MAAVKEEHWATGVANMGATTSSAAPPSSTSTRGPHCTKQNSGQITTPAASIAPSLSLGAMGTPQMPTMYPGFPAGLFNAAFAAAAAATFPNGLGGTAVGTAGTALAANKTCTAESPVSKRRKRDRSSQEECERKPDAATVRAGVASARNTPQGAVPAPKVEACQARTEAVTPGGAGGATSIPGAPFNAGAWPQPMNVLTPCMFSGEISNQERKVSPSILGAVYLGRNSQKSEETLPLF